MRSAGKIIFLLLIFSRMSVSGFCQSAYKLNWKYRIGAGYTGQTVLADSLIYACGDNGSLHVINARTGKRIWKYDAGQDASKLSGPHDSLIFLTTLRDIHIVNIFSKKADTVLRETSGTPMAENGILYYADREKTFKAFDLAKDSVLWEIKGRSYFIGRPAISRDVIYVQDYEDSLFALNKRTGQKVWGYGETIEFFGGDAVLHEDYLLIAHYNKKLYAFDKNTGAVRWTFETNGIFNSEAVVVDSTVYFCSVDKNFYVIDLRTGKKRSQFTSPDAIHSTPAITGGLAFFGSGKFLYALETATKRVRWKFACTYPVYGDPLIHGSNVIFNANDGYLYSLKFN